MTVLEMRAKARRLKAEQNLGLIIVDYLQLMRGHKNMDSREREISEISRSLKALAKELNVPVLALSQLNRGVESRQDKRPQLSDLRNGPVGIVRLRFLHQFTAFKNFDQRFDDVMASEIEGADDFAYFDKTEE